MKFKILFISPLVLALNCSDKSFLESFEEKAKDVDEAARLLEEGNPEKAQQVLLASMPPATTLILNDTELAIDNNFIANLAESIKGDPKAEKKLSIYAAAEAELVKVNSLNIITELAVIDAQEKKKAALTLVGEAEDEAISKFYPAMPPVCESDAIGVNKRLDRAMAIILATAILRGFNPADIESKLREMRSSISKANLLNSAIFAQVNFICPIISYDLNGDTAVDQEEANKMTDTQAEDLYQRMMDAIDAVQAMVDANPSDTSTQKALDRMNLYKAKIEALDAALSLANKVRAFLVVQTKRS